VNVSNLLIRVVDVCEIAMIVMITVSTGYLAFLDDLLRSKIMPTELLYDLS